MSKKKKKPATYITPWEKKCRAKRKAAKYARQKIVDAKKKEANLAELARAEEAEQKALEDSATSTSKNEPEFGPQNEPEKKVDEPAKKTTKKKTATKKKSVVKKSTTTKKKTTSRKKKVD